MNPAASPSSPARPATVTAMCAAMQGIGGGLGWSLLPPLMGTIGKELSISHALGGLVWGAASLGIVVAAPVGGALVDRYGPRRVAGLAMLAGAVICAARAFCHDPWSLLVTMLLFGMHVGLVAPAIPKALAGHVAPGRLGRANGLALLAYTLGTAVTMLVARTVLVPLFGGWRPVMVAAGGLMAVTGVLFLLLVRDRTVAARHAALRQILGLARDGQLLRGAFIYFLLFGGYLALLGLLPRALGETGLRPAHVGLAVAGWLAGAGVANYLGPWLSDRLGRRRPFIIIGALVAAAGYGGFALFGVGGGALGLALLLVAAVGGGCFAPLLLALPLEQPSVGLARAGAALGLLNLVGQVGGFLLSVVAGALVQGAGLAAALGLMALVHLAILLPVRGLAETGPAARAADAARPAAGTGTSAAPAADTPLAA
jgi:NNP family nitrate/nitrite transporter-like MFS transporter